MILETHGTPSGGPYVLGGSFSLVEAHCFGTFGLVHLVPGGAGWFALVDGLGLEGAPSPPGVIPPGGASSVSFSVPSALAGIELHAQALLLASDVPNLLFGISNVASFDLP